MKILTAAQMREVDRLTIERGIPGLILMENAGSRVVDFLCETFRPLANERVVVICGKGNNGGDGFAIARQLFTRRLCRQLTVIELFDPADLSGDAAVHRRMLDACGCPVQSKLPDEPSLATVVVDAILGTGLTGPVKEGAARDAIAWINERCSLARKVAVDIPSGLPSEGTEPIRQGRLHSHFHCSKTRPLPLARLPKCRKARGRPDRQSARTACRFSAEPNGAG